MTIFVENIRYNRHGIYCGRRNARWGMQASPLANPYHLGEGETREDAVAKYNVWLQARLGKDTPQEREIDMLVEMAQAGDVTLLCWCKQLHEPQPACHADAIKAEVERRLPPC